MVENDASDFIKADGLPKYPFAEISVISPKLLDAINVGDTSPLAPLLKQAMAVSQVTGDYSLVNGWMSGRLSG